jgi:hypothetical protein
VHSDEEDQGNPTFGTPPTPDTPTPTSSDSAASGLVELLSASVITPSPSSTPSTSSVPLAPAPVATSSFLIPTLIPVPPPPTLPMSTAPTAGSTTKVQLVAEPKPFDGDSHKFKNFLYEIQLYFQAYSATFNDDDKKIIFVLGYLREGLAAQLRQNFLEAHTNATTGILTLGTYASFLQELKDTFTDPNEATNQRQALEVLKQKSLTAEEFFLQFDTLRRAAGYGDATMHGQFLIGLLERNLNYALIDHIYNINPLPTTYAAYKAAALTLDALHRRKEQIRQYRQNPHASHPHHHAPLSHNIDRRDASGVTFGGRGKPMDIDAQRYGRRNRRRFHTRQLYDPNQPSGSASAAGPSQPKTDKPACFNCGSLEHFAKNCPEPKRQQQPRRFDVRALSDDEKKEVLAELKELGF